MTDTHRPAPTASPDLEHADDVSTPPTPAPPPDPASLPHALTFFLSSSQRRAVLRALKRHERNRSRALLKALRIHEAGSGGGARD